MDKINGQSVAAKIFNLALSRRIDIALIGDSNTIYNSYYGHNYGFRRAWSNAVGMYATGVIGTTWSVEGLGNGYGYTILPGSSNAGAPTFFDQSSLQSSTYYTGSVANYAYLPDGSSIGNTSGSGGIILQSQNTSNNTETNNLPIDTTAEMKWHYTYGTFDYGSGAFQMCVRANSSAYSNFVVSPVIYTNTGSNGFVDAYLDIPAGSKNVSNDPSLYLRPWKFQGDTNVIGPFIMSYQRIEQTNKTTGAALSTLLYQGGMCAHHAAIELQYVKDIALNEFIRQAIRLQGASPVLLVSIHHGGNDRNYTTTPSAGPASSRAYAQGGSSTTIQLANTETIDWTGAQIMILEGTGSTIDTGVNRQQRGTITAYNTTTKIATVSATTWNTPDTTSKYLVGPACNTTSGIVDNHKAIIDRISAIWIAAGYDRANLFFQIGPYHPQVAYVATLQAYENALDSLVSYAQNVFVVHGTQLTNPSELSARGAYAYDGDAHLIKAGSQYFGELAIDAIREAWSAQTQYSSDINEVNANAQNIAQGTTVLGVGGTKYVPPVWQDL